MAPREEEEELQEEDGRPDRSATPTRRRILRREPADGLPQGRSHPRAREPPRRSHRVRLGLPSQGAGRRRGGGQGAPVPRAEPAHAQGVHGQRAAGVRRPQRLRRRRGGRRRGETRARPRVQPTHRRTPGRRPVRRRGGHARDAEDERRRGGGLVGVSARHQGVLRAERDTRGAGEAVRT